MQLQIAPLRFYKDFSFYKGFNIISGDSTSSHSARFKPSLPTQASASGFCSLKSHQWAQSPNSWVISWSPVLFSICLAFDATELWLPSQASDRIAYWVSLPGCLTSTSSQHTQYTPHPFFSFHLICNNLDFIPNFLFLLVALPSAFWFLLSSSISNLLWILPPQPLQLSFHS